MKNIINVVFSLALASFMFVGCCEDEIDACCGNSIQGEIVDFTGLDGCSLILACAEGNLEVVNWNELDFVAEAGMQLCFQYEEYSGGSICMVGPLVVISNVVVL
jgi:hypothetical protein